MDIQSTDDSPVNDAGSERPRKRARVNLACQRCKTRKQRCDGTQPACARCSGLELECHYVSSSTPKSHDKKIYIAALEDRVAQLESYLSGIGQIGIGEDHWNQNQSLQISEPLERDDVYPLLSAVRDLSLSAGGHYVGGTSTITLGRLLGHVVSSQQDILKEQKTNETRILRESDHNPRTISTETLADMMGPMFVSQSVANRLLEGFLKHLATRFPIVPTLWIRELHERKDMIDDIYEEAVLHLVYAAGGRFLETTGETGNFFSDQHYEAALQHMDHILEFRDTRAIVYLLLLAIYCLRSPRDPGSWNFARLAMMPCIELGLHRRTTYREGTLKSEQEKRLFWACYYLDREVSTALGRPPSISDGDIDVELPLDINEGTIDPRTIQEASMNITEIPSSPPTSLTNFIHLLRLKRIESEIQASVYRVSLPTPNDPSTIQSFLNRLSAWEIVVPKESHNFEDNKQQPYDGIEAYMAAYHKVVRLLLYPSLFTTPLNIHFLHLCALASGGICQTYKSLHHSMNFGPSPLSLQSVFLAGLTLIYCAWLSPQKPTFPLDRPLTDCSIMLYVMTERWPLARKYRDIFERIKESVLDIIASGKEQVCQPVPRLDGWNLTLDGGMFGTVSQELEQMIGDMTGGPKSGETLEGFEFQDMAPGNDWHLMNIIEPASNDGHVATWN